jgi:ribonuclease Y
MDIISIIIGIVVGLVVGLFIGRSLLKKVFVKEEQDAREKAKLILREAEINAENIKKERMLESKEKFLRLKAEFEEDSNKKKNLIIQNEQKVKQREQAVAKQIEDFKKNEKEVEALKGTLNTQLEGLKKRQEQAEKDHQSIVSQLEKIAGLTASEAREQMVEALKNEAQIQASSYIKDTVANAKLTAAKDAKKVVLETIQRTAAEHAIENCVSIFNIESDDELLRKYKYDIPVIMIDGAEVFIHRVDADEFVTRIRRISGFGG